jgi:hypothetical protein
MPWKVIVTTLTINGNKVDAADDYNTELALAA